MGYMDVDDFIVDDGAMHYADTNYFSNGYIREDGGLNPPLCSDPRKDWGPEDIQTTYWKHGKIYNLWSFERKVSNKYRGTMVKKEEKLFLKH